jgi:hypothetical protein
MGANMQPEPDTRGQSVTIVRNAIELVDKALHPDGGCFDPRLKDLISETVREGLDQLVAAAQPDPARSQVLPSPVPAAAPTPPSKSALVALGFVVATCLITSVGVVTLTSSRLEALEKKESERATYETIVANWIVVRAHTDDTRAANLDSMLRKIAAQVNADVSAIEPPVEGHPPSQVQRRNLEYREANDL